MWIARDSSEMTGFSSMNCRQALAWVLKQLVHDLHTGQADGKPVLNRPNTGNLPTTILDRPTPLLDRRRSTILPNPIRTRS